MIANIRHCGENATMVYVFICVRLSSGAFEALRLVVFCMSRLNPCLRVRCIKGNSPEIYYLGGMCGGGGWVCLGWVVGGCVCVRSGGV